MENLTSSHGKAGILGTRCSDMNRNKVQFANTCVESSYSFNSLIQWNMLYLLWVAYKMACNCLSEPASCAHHEINTPSITTNAMSFQHHSFRNMVVPECLNHVDHVHAFSNPNPLGLGDFIAVRPSPHPERPTSGVVSTEVAKERAHTSPGRVDERPSDPRHGVGSLSLTEECVHPSNELFLNNVKLFCQDVAMLLLIAPTSNPQN